MTGMPEASLFVPARGGIALATLPALTLYVHIPWCVRKCPYCDFNSHELRVLQSEPIGTPERQIGADLEARYVAALTADLEQTLPLVWGRRVHAVAAGRKLVEGQIGVAAGRLLDPLLPNAYAQVRYMYGVPEKVLGISHNRSQVNFEVGYLLGPALTVRALGSWQMAHGGWRVPIDLPPFTSPQFQVHDQLNRTDYLRLGGGVSYSLTGSVDVNVYGYGTVWGRNDVNMRAFGASLTWSASPAQLIKKRRGQELQQ